MSKGVTFLREAGKSVTDEYLAKVLDGNKTSASFAVPSKKGNAIAVNKHIGAFNLDEAKKFIGHEALKERTVAVHFGDDINVADRKDVQPYVILEGPVVDEKMGAPKLMVAFLDGDFSQFTQEGSTKSPEEVCVEKRIIPIVAKAYRYAKEDLHDTFIELKDDLNAETFVNLMIGDTGCITLMGANGETHCFLVNGETLSGDIDGGWATNTFQEEAKPAETTVEEWEKELEGEPAQAPVTKPVETSPPAVTTQRSGGMPPITRKPGHGLQGSKPNTPVAAPVAKPDVGPSKDSPPVLPDISDPEAILTLDIPDGMEGNLARKAKWMSTRMPEGFLPKVISGLKQIKLPRKQCNGKFLQSYVEQNKLAGLKDALSGSTAVQAPKRSGGMPPPAKNTAATQHPDSGTNVSSAKKDGDKAVSKGVTDEKLPIFTPIQIEETISFKNAVDAKGRPIVSPEEMEKKIGTFHKMFGDGFKIGDTRNWDMDERIEYAKHSSEMVAKLWYWLDHEIAQAYDMLDKFVEPHKTKNEEVVVEPRRKVAGGGMPPIRR